MRIVRVAVVSSLVCWFVPGCSSPSESGGGAGVAAGDCAALAEALCSLGTGCVEGYAKGPVACRQDLTASCERARTLPGTGFTDAAIAECTQQYQAASCADLFGRGCEFAGELADGEPCVSGGQCQSGSCEREQDSACGTCSTLIPPGSSCTDDFDCDFVTQACVSGRCVQAGLEGDSCDEANPCTFILTCNAGTCGLGTGEPGDPCTEPSDCNLLTSITCGAGQCQPYTEPAELGESCLGGASCLGDSTCTGGSDAVCVERPKEGEPCKTADGSPLQCTPPASCVAGTCIVPDAQACSGT